MKKFSFPLDRVLSWRQTQTRLEEANLERLTAEFRSLELRDAALQRSVREAGVKLTSAGFAFPSEIGALEHFRVSANAQCRHFAISRVALEKKIALQTQVVIQRRRDAHLLERLRDSRLTQWRSAAAREVEQQAEESYMARLARATPFQ